MVHILRTKSDFLEFLAKRGSQLGGNTGQMLLRFLGWDGFVTSKDVVACLRDAGLVVADAITSKRDLASSFCRRLPGETSKPRASPCLH